MQHEASGDRKRDCRREFVIATHNVLTVTVDIKDGVSQAAEVLGMYQDRKWVVTVSIDLKKTWRSG